MAGHWQKLEKKWQHLKYYKLSSTMLPISVLPSSLFLSCQSPIFVLPSFHFCPAKLHNFSRGGPSPPPQVRLWQLTWHQLKFSWDKNMQATSWSKVNYLFFDWHVNINQPLKAETKNIRQYWRGQSVEQVRYQHPAGHESDLLNYSPSFLICNRSKESSN